MIVPVSFFCSILSNVFIVWGNLMSCSEVLNIQKLEKLFLHSPFICSTHDLSLHTTGIKKENCCIFYTLETFNTNYHHTHTICIPRDLNNMQCNLIHMQCICGQYSLSWFLNILTLQTFHSCGFFYNIYKQTT